MGQPSSKPSSSSRPPSRATARGRSRSRCSRSRSRSKSRPLLDSKSIDERDRGYPLLPESFHPESLRRAKGTNKPKPKYDLFVTPGIAVLLAIAARLWDMSAPSALSVRGNSEDAQNADDERTPLIRRDDEESRSESPSKAAGLKGWFVHNAASKVFAGGLRIY